MTKARSIQTMTCECVVSMKRQTFHFRGESIRFELGLHRVIFFHWKKFFCVFDKTVSKRMTKEPNSVHNIYTNSSDPFINSHWPSLLLSQSSFHFTSSIIQRRLYAAKLVHKPIVSG